jgi:uncharacterized alkaline shock family protein YloU
VTVELTSDVPGCEAHVASQVIAAIAARAATGTSGVIRLEPGLVGLVGSLVRTARGQLTGVDPAPTDGVRVTDESDGLHVEVDLVTSGQDQVAAVAARVQRAVARSVRDATGLPVAGVTVSVLDVELTR